MPRDFAHITAMMVPIERPDESASLTRFDKRAVMPFRSFVEIGAIGSDCPYLGKLPDEIPKE